jgi:hypothetical protein
MTAEERLERLEVELRRARRWTRLWRLLLVGLVVGSYLLLSRLAGRELQIQADQKEVHANRFILVDNNGKPRAMLAMLEDGPSLSLLGENGKGGALLTVDKKGPGLSLFDEKGRVELNVTERGPELNLKDKNAFVKPRALLIVTKEGPWLAFWDESGKLRAALSVLEDGPGLGLYGPDGKVLWQAP